MHSEAKSTETQRRGLMRRVATRVVTSLPANQKSSTLRIAVMVKAAVHTRLFVRDNGGEQRRRLSESRV